MSSAIKPTTNVANSHIPSFDPRLIRASFMTENMADLVVNGTNKIFFYINTATNVDEETYSADSDRVLNLTDARLKFYDTKATGSPIREAVKGINSAFNGLG